MILYSNRCCYPIWKCKEIVLVYRYNHSSSTIMFIWLVTISMDNSCCNWKELWKIGRPMTCDKRVLDKKDLYLDMIDQWTIWRKECRSKYPTLPNKKYHLLKIWGICRMCALSFLVRREASGNFWAIGRISLMRRSWRNTTSTVATNWICICIRKTRSSSEMLSDHSLPIRKRSNW